MPRAAQAPYASGRAIQLEINMTAFKAHRLGLRSPSAVCERADTSLLPVWGRTPGLPSRKRRVELLKTESLTISDWGRTPGLSSHKRRAELLKTGP